MARPGSWMDAISRYRGTTTAAPNFGFALAARDLRLRPRELDLSSLTGAGSGAEAIDPETIDSFTREAEKYGFRPEHFFPMYGLAENTLHAYRRDLEDLDDWFRAAGSSVLEGSADEFRRYLRDQLPQVYPVAVEGAIAETNLPDEAFPSGCPFSRSRRWRRSISSRLRW